MPKANKTTASELTPWTRRFEQLQKTYAVLMGPFWQEAERFAAKHGDVATGWKVVGGAQEGGRHL